MRTAPSSGAAGGAAAADPVTAEVGETMRPRATTRVAAKDPKVRMGRTMALLRCGRIEPVTGSMGGTPTERCVGRSILSHGRGRTPVPPREMPPPDLFL